MDLKGSKESQKSWRWVDTAKDVVLLTDRVLYIKTWQTNTHTCWPQLFLFGSFFLKRLTRHHTSPNQSTRCSTVSIGRYWMLPPRHCWMPRTRIWNSNLLQVEHRKMRGMLCAVRKVKKTKMPPETSRADQQGNKNTPVDSKMSWAVTQVYYDIRTPSILKSYKVWISVFFLFLIRCCLILCYILILLLF